MKKRRGGYRDGAGRPSTWKTGPTMAVKIPIALKDRVIEYARQLDTQNLSNSLIEPVLDNVTISKSKLETIFSEILSDSVITRQGKDRGTVRKVLERLEERLK